MTVTCPVRFGLQGGFGQSCTWQRTRLATSFHGLSELLRLGLRDRHHLLSCSTPGTCTCPGHVELVTGRTNARQCCRAREAAKCKSFYGRQTRHLALPNCPPHGSDYMNCAPAYHIRIALVNPL